MAAVAQDCYKLKTLNKSSMPNLQAQGGRDILRAACVPGDRLGCGEFPRLPLDGPLLRAGHVFALHACQQPLLEFPVSCHGGNTLTQGGKDRFRDPCTAMYGILKQPKREKQPLAV